ncbi:radical SAM protein [Abyssisolibacter fermentans]|uniref:radical SAM protein n=1 Tax=Abyssisolibacter fermentans TaxID=1766203 RepID=UPI00138F7BB4|nr:radical SAM protein [Abyssisolibacter fermentans]
MSEKIDGKKTEDEIIKEIADELELNDIKKIGCIFDEFVESKPLLIKKSKVPKNHIIKRTGIKGKNVPLNIILSLTNKCVMNCEHCYKSCSTKGNKSLNYNKLMNVLKFLTGKSLTLQLTGGEPMAYDSFLDVLDYCSENFRTTITTTAVMINNKNIDHFKKVERIQVSVYSNDSKEHDMITNLEGSFEKTINGIDTIVKASIPVTIATIITKRNKDRLEDMIDLAVEHGVNQLNFGALIPMGRGIELKDTICLSTQEKEQITEIIDKLSDRYKDKIYIQKWKTNSEMKKMDDQNCYDCGAGLFQWVISEYGNIKPCDYVPDDIFSVGCIEEENIEDILDKYTMDKLSQSTKKWEDKLNRINSSVKEICPIIMEYYNEKCI